MRARNIKPSFFLNEELADLDSSCKLLFIGLWCLADRDGYLQYRPRRICAEIFPYNQTFRPKVCPWLDNLAESGLIRFWYEKGNNPNNLSNNEPLGPRSVLGLSRAGQECSEKTQVKTLVKPQKPFAIEVINFAKHQRPHRREKESEIKSLVDRSVLGRSWDGPRCPERGMRNEERGIHTPPQHPKPGEGEKEKIKQPILSIPLNKKGTEFHIFDEDIREWQETFSGIDVLQELKVCRQWNIDNPKRRKTKGGIRNHISTWLGKKQNSGQKTQAGNKNLTPRQGYMGALGNAIDNSERITGTSQAVKSLPGGGT